MEEEYNQKRINPPIWQHDYHVLKGLYRGLNEIIDKYLKKEQKCKLLDYGCGSKPYKNLFLSYISQYIGVDITQNPRADKIVKEDQRLPYKSEHFNIILSTQVFEHVENTEFYFSECLRLLGNGGFLILSTHGLWPYHPYPSDYYRWTRIGLKEMIKSRGFNIERCFSILGPFASVIQFELLIIAERLRRLGIFGKIFLAVLSIFGNTLIWFVDKFAPPTEVSDASLFLICAKKI